MARTARSVEVRQSNGTIELVFDLGDEAGSETIVIAAEDAQALWRTLSSRFADTRRDRRLAAIDRIRAEQQKIVDARDGVPFSAEEIDAHQDAVIAARGGRYFDWDEVAALLDEVRSGE